MKKLFVVLMMLLAITAGAFASDWGIGYVSSATMNAITVTFDPIPLITVQGAVSLFNAGLNNPTVSLKDWGSSTWETIWPSDYYANGNFGASVNAGSFGMRCLANLERPTPNTKFYAGAGFNVLFLSVDAKYKDDYDTISIKGSGYTVELIALTGFEWRPKEVPNLGLYAEVGYGITCIGAISGTIKIDDESSSLKVEPNAYLGHTFYGLGITWYF